MQSRPFTIVFEGGEAAGKTSQIRRLVEVLQDRGETVVSTGVFRTPHGAFVRDWLMDADRANLASFQSQVFVLASAMNQVAEEIRATNATVAILDRFVYSTMAYHGGGLGLGVSIVEEIYAPVLTRFSPDLVIFLDFSPARMVQRKTPGDRVEAQPLDFHQRVRSTFVEIVAQLPQAVTIDAEDSEDEVHAYIRDIVLRRVGERLSRYDGA